MGPAQTRLPSSPAVRVPVDDLARFCARWDVDTVELYGSVVSDDFRDEDPVEVMVTFAPSARPSLFTWSAMEDELSAAFGRPATLTTRRAAESDAYPDHHRRMRETARVVYAR
jgi:predicted nucleotidyltransferase